MGAARARLKSIVFVNTKADAVKVARDISDLLPSDIEPTELEKAQWTALEAELGGRQHAVLSGPAIAVPHNSAMLKLERDLCESLFRREDGALVILATPTLAQGLNLPAHLAILAGDKRTDAGRRESLKAHEILNAAARAGRAGHLANGLVLLIPEPIIGFNEVNKIANETVAKLRSVLPEDDHCVTVSHPLEIVLDRIMGGHPADSDVIYTINRFAVLREVEGGTEEPTALFNLNKSLGAFLARKRKTDAAFNEKLGRFKERVTEAMPGTLDGRQRCLRLKAVCRQSY